MFIFKRTANPQIHPRSVANLGIRCTLPNLGRKGNCLSSQITHLWFYSELYIQSKSKFMKAKHILLAFSTLLVFGLQSCLKDNCDRTVTYISIEPVYKTLDEIRSGTVVNEAPRELVNPGQLYYYNDHIFINEKKEGIHIIDNSDPSNPITIAFLAIPGNENLAIKDGVLYANTYIDLLAIDLQTYQALGRVENAFPPFWEDIQTNVVLVDYLEVPKTEVMDCATYETLIKNNGAFYAIDVVFAETAFDLNSSLNSNQSSGSGIVGGGGGTGVGGSMARFTIMGNYLYAIDNWTMDLFDLSQPDQPVLTGTVDIGWGIETIFPYEDKLFIGSNNGMFIYDNSDPTNPVQLAAFAHARACDPVFVKDNYAYVTLRSGNTCEGFNNQLDLIDITEITDPQLIFSFPMDNPHGLTIKENNLLLCEGEFGLKSFDISDPLTLNQRLLDRVEGIFAFDAISIPGADDVVMVIGEDGFYQYDFSDPANLVLLSKIPVLRL